MQSLLTHAWVTSALLLAGCGKSVPIESVESLVTNPERLRELRTQCRTDRAAVGEAQCNAVTEAMRRRFLRPTPSPYANDPLRPLPPPAVFPLVRPSSAKD